MKNTWCAVLLIGLINCGGDNHSPHEMASEKSNIIDWLKIRYGEPRASECTQNEDCGESHCCLQISNQDQQCYPDADDVCHIRWAGLPSSFLPRWDDDDKRARYTGDFEADVIEERVVDVWGSGRSRIYKLANGQYWEAIAPSQEPSVGDTVRVAPGAYHYNMDAGNIVTSIDLLGVVQLPVVADTEVVGPFEGMEQDGLYALSGAGYWRVSEASASREPRVILTTPNNVDFWMYTSSAARVSAQPARIYADGAVINATAMEFTLDDGTNWRYMVARPLDPVVIGARAVVFNLAIYDDRHIDHDYPHQYCWHEGGENFGEWVSPLSRL